MPMTIQLNSFNASLLDSHYIVQYLQNSLWSNWISFTFFILLWHSWMDAADNGGYGQFAMAPPAGGIQEIWAISEKRKLSEKSGCPQQRMETPQVATSNKKEVPILRGENSTAKFKVGI
jgi:hypothetical protein